MGAWIEISSGMRDAREGRVAPLVGAWIEIATEIYKKALSASLPSWERGLKLDRLSITDTVDPRRSPRGSVD